MKKLLVTLAGIVMALTPTVALISCSVPKLQANQRQLSFVIKQTNLGKFNNKELNTDLVISKIYELNPGAYANLKEALKDLVLDLKTKVLSSKGMYEGTVKLTWTQNTNTNKALLSSVIIEKNLGEIQTDNLTSDMIISQVIKLNPGAYQKLDEAIADLIVNEETKTITSRDKYDGWVTLTWSISSEGQQPGPEAKEQLSSVIVNPNLNARADIEVNEEILIKKVYFLNPGAYTNEQAALADLKLDLGTKILSSKNEYEGTVKLLWGVPTPVKKQLSSVITKTKLGEFKNKELNSDLVISKIFDLNSGAYTKLKTALSDLNLDLTTKVLTSNGMYEGLVTLSWMQTNSSNKTLLSSVIKQTYIGQFQNKNLTQEMIINNVYELNKNAYPTLEAAKKDLIVNTNTKTITSKNDYDGWVKLSWTIAGEAPTEKINLKDVILEKQLSALDNGNQQTILDAIIAKNPITAMGLTINDLEITPNGQGALIKAKPDSLQFTGQVDVSFSIKTELKAVIIETDLGILQASEVNSNTIH